MLSRSDGC